MIKIETPVCPISDKCEPRNFDDCYVCSLIHMQDIQMFMLRLKQFPWTIKKGGNIDGSKKNEK